MGKYLYSTQRLMLQGDPVADTLKDGKPERRVLFGSPSEWLWVGVFLITQSLFGFSVYPALLIAFVMLIVALKSRPYDALVMMVIMGAGYSLSVGHYRIQQALMLVSVIGCFTLRLNKYVKRVLVIYLTYIIGTYLIASTSMEAMSVQMHGLTVMWLGITFMIPLLVFADRGFDIMEFFRVLFLYIIGISVCYFFDCAIFNGYLFFPYGRFIAFSELSAPSLSAIWWDPLSFKFPRISPNAMLFMLLGIYPLVHFVKLRWWMWALVAWSFFAIRTATVTTAAVLTYIFFKFKGKKLLAGIIAVVIVVPLLYEIDVSTGRNLRVADTVDQFAILTGPGLDDETLGEFATGRFAQWIPKYDYLLSLKREWVGFGFIDPMNTKSHLFTIDNDLYEDGTIEETVTGVEIATLQTILSIGYLGLILQTFTYLSIYFVIRKLKYSGYYLSMLVASFIAGLGGMGGWQGQTTLLTIALSLGVVLVVNRQEEKGSEQEDISI